MNHHHRNKLPGVTAAVAVQPRSGIQTHAQVDPATPVAPATVGMLVYPTMTARDLMRPPQSVAVVPEFTMHSAFHTLLPPAGARPVAARVTGAHNRMSGGRVTPGIDVWPTLPAWLVREDAARGWQLGTGDTPQPPFDTGTPEQAGAVIEEDVPQIPGPRVEAARQALLNSPGYASA